VLTNTSFGKIGLPLLVLLRNGLLWRSGIYFSATIINTAIPFLLLPLLTRALGPANYGVIGTFTALVAVAAVFIGLNTQGILSVVYFKGDAHRFAQSITACLLVLCITAPCMALLLFFFRAPLAGFSGIDAAWQWTIAGAATGDFALSIALAVCQIRGRAVHFVALQIANTLINIGLVCGLVLGLGWGWQGRALAQCCTALGMGLAGIILISRDYDLAELPPRSAVREALHFGFPLVPHTLTTVIRNSFDRLLIAGVIGTVAAGKYFVAFQVATVLTLICTAINQAWTPWLFERLARGTMRDKVEIVRTTYMVMAAYFIMTLAVMVLGPFLIALLAGQKFADSGAIIAILVPAAGFNGAYYLFTNYIFFAQRTTWLAAITVGVAITQTLLTILFVRLWGATGAAIATLTCGALYFSAVWAAAQRLVPMPWLSWRSHSVALKS
jgi:O-antigen/teichoic acid export membrane protein